MESRDAHVLENRFYGHIPITKYFGIRVVNYDGLRLVVRAPLAVNVDHCGTAFAGSIGAVLMLGGLAIIRLKLADLGITARIMLASSKISYLHPVTEDIEVFCETRSPINVARVRHHLSRDGAATIKITGGIESASKVVVKYAGSYIIRILKTEDINHDECFC